LTAGRKTGYFNAIFLEELCLKTIRNNRIKTRLVLPPSRSPRFGGRRKVVAKATLLLCEVSLRSTSAE